MISHSGVALTEPERVQKAQSLAGGIFFSPWTNLTLWRQVLNRMLIDVRDLVDLDSDECPIIC